MFLLSGLVCANAATAAYPATKRPSAKTAILALLTRPLPTIVPPVSARLPDAAAFECANQRATDSFSADSKFGDSRLLRRIPGLEVYTRSPFPPITSSLVQCCHPAVSDACPAQTVSRMKFFTPSP